MSMASVFQFLYQKLLLSVFTIFASVSSFFSPMVTFITRLRKSNAHLSKNSDVNDVFPETEQVSDSESDVFKDVPEFPESGNDEGIEKSEFCFTFKFPTYEEFCKSREDKGEFVSSECEKIRLNLLETKDLEKVESEKIEVLEKVDSEKIEVFKEEIEVNVGNLTPGEEEIEKKIEEINSMKGELDVGNKHFPEDPYFTDESMFQSEKDSSCTDDSDTVSIGFEHMRYLMSRLVDSYSDGFLTDDDFGGGEFELDGDLKMFEENQELDAHNDGDVDDDDSDIMEELRKLEHDQEHRFLSQDDFPEDVDKLLNDSDSVKPRKVDANKLESLWEHQELIEQLKMELRKVRDIGLPTILEESESPKMEELQPWRIEEQLLREDCMSELHKFYKSYRERMRKFDILTYQKMYAIGYLQKDPLKDPLEQVSSQSSSSSGPKLKPLISQNIRLFKHKSTDDNIMDPMVKFIKELQSDLEVIYVGQMCLSWEFLHWQYGKAISLWDSDPRGIRTYNEVAGEFQQFQVLLQRFMENEPFQGPRIQYYIKSRYDLRNLLQVPVIRVDKMKGKNNAGGKAEHEYFITSDMLIEILEESIRIFWQFVRSDRVCSSVKMKDQKRNHQEIQAAADLDLLMEVRKSLEKKEKKLKAALRGECCILKRFKKYNEEEDPDNHVLYFFSQVDMKLVDRVLKMSKLTTDQLVWCHNKLTKISFSHRKIHVDPSFMLFPC